MTPVQPAVSVTGVTGAPNMIHLLLSGEVKVSVQKPEQVMADIQLRATKVSTVLEGILLESRGQQRWGLNE